LYAFIKKDEDLRLPSFSSFSETDGDFQIYLASRESTRIRQRLPWPLLTAAATVLLGVTLLFLVVASTATTTSWHDTDTLVRRCLSLSDWQSYGTNDEFAPDEEFLTPEDYIVNLGPPQPLGSACLTAANCVGGAYCAFPSVRNQTIRICCTNAIPLLGQHSLFAEAGAASPEESLWLTVCTHLGKVGEPCAGHNELCTSGHCIKGICAQAALSNGVRCDKDSSCHSGACGYDGGDASSGDNRICCPSGQVYIAQPPGLPYKMPYCAQLPIGAQCGNIHEVCASGRCHHGICHPTQASSSSSTTT
jgi:hypothetical protein